MDKKMVPEVRFKGFSDDWELRKLGTLYKINRERNLIGITKDKTISISSMSFNTSGNNANISSIPNYKVLRIGDLAYEGHTNRSFSFGRFVLNDIGTGIMSPRFSSLRPIKDMNVNYWKHYIHYEPIMKYILVKSTKRGTMMNELVPNDLFKQQIHVPSDMEQNKIGQLLNLLDISITLQQQQLDLYTKLKKGLLQKQFTSDQEKVPKIRFYNFHENWEQRKLERMVDLFSGLTYSPNDIKSSGTFVIRSSNIKFGNIVNADNVYVDNKVVNSSNIMKGDIIVVVRNGSRALIGKHALVRKSMSKTVIGAFMTGIRSATPSFTNSLFDTQKFKKEINKNLGSTINQITNGSLKKMSFNVPNSLEEKNKIGTSFEIINKIIILEQERLNELKSIKKYLLQKLFI